MDITGFKRILIIKPSSLGDVIHALPVAAELMRGIPDARIDWVVGSPFRDILEGNPDIAGLIPFDRGLLKGGRAAKDLVAFVGELRRERYDLVIDLQGLLRSGLMAAACRAERRAGFANAREGAPFFYTDRVRVPDINIHAVDRYLLALRHLGVPVGDRPLFRIATGPEDEGQADALIRAAGIAEGEPFAAFAPSARWETKRWPASNFLELARRLRRERGLKALFVGSAGDRGLFGGLDISGLEDSFAFGRTTLKGLAARAWCVRRGHPFTTSFHTQFPEYIWLRWRVPLTLTYALMRWFHGPASCVMTATASLRQRLSHWGFRRLGE